MLLLPFIENSFKHSNFENKSKGWININIRFEGKTILVNIKNSANLTTSRKDNVGGVGMENVKKRLSLIYPDKHELSIKHTQENYEVKLKIKLG